MEPFGQALRLQVFLRAMKMGYASYLLRGSDIVEASNSLRPLVRVFGDGTAKTGAHGNPVLFLHPKDFNGTLIELEQIDDNGEVLGWNKENRHMGLVSAWLYIFCCGGGCFNDTTIWGKGA